MTYWHLQMSLPDGRDGIHIDSTLLLKEDKPVIGTGEWDNFQCKNFKNTIQIGDIVCVKDGSSPIALCRVISDNFNDDKLREKYINYNYRYVDVLEFYDGSEPFPQPQGTLQIAENEYTRTWQFINNWFNSYKQNEAIKKRQKAMENILNVLENKKQIILQGPPGTGKTYNAKNIAELLITGNVSEDKTLQKELLEETGQFELIQFHPSYSYEDFVRSITVNVVNGQPEYITENKVLGRFAAMANDNSISSRKDDEVFSKEKQIEKLLEDFAEHVRNEIDEKGEYKITEAVSIVEVDEQVFRYQGNWKTSQRMKFNDLVKAHLYGATSRRDFKSIPGISGLAIQHASYFFKVLCKFKGLYKDELQSNETPEVDKPPLKKYVLIIDEINRANLPAVLGELIYALEYRGESVNSIYAIDGDLSIVIPDNLYIIGTMNTADRSVGHIDYAIRRRFAFEKMLPNIDVIETEEGKRYFKEIEMLFINDSLSPDYKNSKEDVQIGHSYFMGEEANLKMRMKYEVLPIIQEYLKDGIFKEEARVKIEAFENSIS